MLLSESLRMPRLGARSTMSLLSTATKSLLTFVPRGYYNLLQEQRRWDKLRESCQHSVNKARAEPDEVEDAIYDDVFSLRVSCNSVLPRILIAPTQMYIVLITALQFLPHLRPLPILHIKNIHRTKSWIFPSLTALMVTISPSVSLHD